MRDEIVPVEHMVNLEKAAYKAKFIDRVKLYNYILSIQYQMEIIIQIGQEILKNILMQ